MLKSFNFSCPLNCRVNSADHYLQEAKKLKHNADALVRVCLLAYGSRACLIICMLFLWPLTFCVSPPLRATQQLLSSHQAHESLLFVYKGVFKHQNKCLMQFVCVYAHTHIHTVYTHTVLLNLYQYSCFTHLLVRSY